MAHRTSSKNPVASLSLSNNQIKVDLESIPTTEPKSRINRSGFKILRRRLVGWLCSIVYLPAGFVSSKQWSSRLQLLLLASGRNSSSVVSGIWRRVFKVCVLIFGAGMSGISSVVKGKVLGVEKDKGYEEEVVGAEVGGRARLRMKEDRSYEKMTGRIR
ncbi:hypothetical protein BJ508DRAFT_149694 [Ascobolus immersus RN42]|uniref:Uncharacterized protein n=1 Tax=Ascobolus immersus RN42 TaxID=1160509 RepID=A0A3N4IQ69_ASCIM|nr:hypothetical protein BJ508DRAFT_149694 [Ascobolus immersus RN42]